MQQLISIQNTFGKKSRMHEFLSSLRFAESCGVFWYQDMGIPYFRPANLILDKQEVSCLLDIL